jgi:hypothetical protein
MSGDFCKEHGLQAALQELTMMVLGAQKTVGSCADEPKMRPTPECFLILLTFPLCVFGFTIPTIASIS